MKMNKVNNTFSNMINEMNEEDLNEMVERNLNDNRRRVVEDLEEEEWENRIDLINNFRNEGYEVTEDMEEGIEIITSELKEIDLKEGKNFVFTLRNFENDNFKYYDLFAIVKNNQIQNFRIYNGNSYKEYETLVEAIIKWEGKKKQDIKVDYEEGMIYCNEKAYMIVELINSNKKYALCDQEGIKEIATFENIDNIIDYVKANN